jgi:hypothetical protein
VPAFRLAYRFSAGWFSAGVAPESALITVGRACPAA